MTSAQNRETLTLLPLCPKNICTGSTPFVRANLHHKFRKIQSYLPQKVQISGSKQPPCPQNICTEITSYPLTADVFYGLFVGNYSSWTVRRRHQYNSLLQGFLNWEAHPLWGAQKICKGGANDLVVVFVMRT